jgi:hypothetical protein
MNLAIEMNHNGRQLEIRAAVVGGDWQIWVHENGNKIYLYNVIPFQSADGIPPLVEAELRRAKGEIEAETIIVPVVRMWPARNPSSPSGNV